MRALVVIAGTFASQRMSNSYYAPLYPTKVLALPGGGRGHLLHTYQAISPTLHDWIEQQDEPVVLVGHSQGAIHALAFALDHPELVASVIGIAGPFDGASAPTIPPNLERYVKRIVPVGLDFQRGSAYLRDLQEQALEGEVTTTLIAGRSDRLVSPASAHAVHPATKAIHDGGHSTVLHQYAIKHLLREIREG